MLGTRGGVCLCACVCVCGGGEGYMPHMPIPACFHVVKSDFKTSQKLRIVASNHLYLCQLMGFLEGVNTFLLTQD